MPNFQNDSVVSVSNSISTAAVRGEGTLNEGVRGVSHNSHGGVVGVNDWSPPAPSADGGHAGALEAGLRVDGGHAGALEAGLGPVPRHDSAADPFISAGGVGVYGQSAHGIGVVGESTANEGVRGVSHNPHGGVVGINDSPPPGGNGGWFESALGEGVRGWSKNPDHGGVVGVNTKGGIGVYGTSAHGEGVHADTHSISTAAMAAYQLNPDSETAALYAKHAGNRTAAIFDGSVSITGEIDMIGGADCAEDFDVAVEALAEPGTVMVLDDEGMLRESHCSFDKRVAGVISGAGNYKPGLVLDKQQSQSNRKPIALLGKVFCKADAQFGPIGVGDLLTTSPTPGHAMRVDDPLKAFGAVIGKALRPLTEGRGLIPILAALQ
jgi:hypothetical protein